MQHFVYIAGLIFGLCGMAIIDYRFKLALFRDARRALRTVGTAVLFFVIWDIAGIGLTIFYDGAGQYTTGLLLGPNFPIEELFFLTLLTYTTLVVWIAIERKSYV